MLISVERRFQLWAHPWLSKIAENKDLKPLRKASFTIEATHWLNYLSVVDEETRVCFLKCYLQDLLEDVMQPDIGWSSMRLEIWRAGQYLDWELWYFHK